MKHALVAMLAIVGPALAEDLPLNPAVTQETIGATICVPGWTKTVRPPAALTNAIKRRLIRELEIPDELLTDFELDHRIPLALGGAPADPRNLELQPWDEAGEKDQIEARLARAVCASKIGLDEARQRIWSDWREVGKIAELPRRAARRMALEMNSLPIAVARAHIAQRRRRLFKTT